MNNNIFKNSTFNIFGAAIPLVAGIFTIPVLLGNMGHEKFAILSIAWVLTGYFSIFDIGIGKALTKSVSERSEKEKNDVSSLFSTAIIAMIVIGLLIGGLLLHLSPTIAIFIEKNQSLNFNLLELISIISITVPFIVVSNAFRGLLEGYQDFLIINIIRTSSGLATFIIPAIISHFSSSLFPIILSLLLIRIVILLVYAIATFKRKISFHLKLFNKKNLVELSVFGGWITVSYIIGPLLLYAGHFILMSLIPLSNIPYYSVPYEIATKLLLIPGALAVALFPQFSNLNKINPKKSRMLCRNANIYLALFLAPIIILIFIFSSIGLSYWINVDFAENSHSILKILLLSVFINSFGHIFQSFIQAFGRADITAKIHMVEFILFIPYCWILIENYQAKGAAYAWLIRVIISTTFLSLTYKGLKKMTRDQI